MQKDREMQLVRVAYTIGLSIPCIVLGVDIAILIRPSPFGGFSMPQNCGGLCVISPFSERIGQSGRTNSPKNPQNPEQKIRVAAPVLVV